MRKTAKRKLVTDIIKEAGDLGLSVPADVVLDIANENAKQVVSDFKIPAAALPIYTLRKPGAVPAPKEKGLVLGSEGWIDPPMESRTIGLGGFGVTGNFTSTAPLVLSAARQLVGGAADISIPAATALVDGYLTAVDWGTFNGKQNALTFPLAANLGGTGIANAAGSTLTLGAALSVTGGGTIVLGGFTLTVPATGTAALLATANVFTALQTITVGNITTALAINHSPTDGTVNNFSINGTTTLATALATTAAQRILNFVGTLSGSGGGSGSVEGIVSDVRYSQTSGTLTSLIGFRAITRQMNAALLTSLVGYEASPITSATGAGNISTYVGFRANAWSASGASTINASYGFRALNQGNVNVNVSCALYVDAQSGSASNYSIYTNAGLNSLGDQLAIVGSANRQQLIVTGFSTQAIATPMAQVTRNDATAGISAMLGLTALGSGANGDGGSILLNGKSSTTAAQAMSAIQYLWTDATHASRNSRFQIETYPAGTAIGHSAFWSQTAIAGTALTIIANGTGDVTEAITLQYVASEIAGTDVGGGIVVLEPNTSYNIVDDATNTLTLTCAADGSVTIARSAGTDTYKFSAWMVWQ